MRIFNVGTGFSYITLMLFCVLILTGISRADDGGVEVFGGNVKLMSEHPTVRMAGENVTITMKDSKFYDVDATFVFYNNGGSTTTFVGFPVGGFSPGEDIPGEFKKFRTYVNGAEIHTTDKVTVLEGGYKHREEKWKVKEVHFPGKQNTITRVVYTAPYGGSSNGDKFIRYTIGTGSSWYGSIGRSTFTFVFDEDAFLGREVQRPFDTYRASTLAKANMKFSRNRNTLQWFVDEFEPDPSDSFEVNLLNFKNHLPLPFGHPSEYKEYPFDKSIIDRHLLETFSVAQLKLCLNECYARLGKTFKDQSLQDYLNSREWYKSNPKYKISTFNNNERENIRRISEYIKELSR